MKHLSNRIMKLFVLLGVVVFLGTSPKILAQGPDNPEDGSSGTSYFDYSIDLNQDGLPDQLVEAVESLTVQARGHSERTSAEASDNFAARLPYSAQTRQLQAQVEQLGQQLLAEDLDLETYQALEAEMRALEGQMERNDSNYALTLRTLENLAWQKMQAQVQEANASAGRSTNAAAQGINFADLQRGDFMFSNGNDFATNFLYAMMWAHVATFDGGTNVYEAQLEEPAGVRRADYFSWQVEGTRLAFGRNNQKSQSKVIEGLEWAKNRWGTDARTPYNLKFWQPFREDALYCSQLIWRIHRHIGTDLLVGGAQSIYDAYLKAKWGLNTHRNPTSFVISPDAIALDNDVSLYAIGVYDYEPRIYLPDIRVNGSKGDNENAARQWNSQITVRNNAPDNIDVRVVYLDPSGRPYSSEDRLNLAANAIWQPPTRLSHHQGHSGSAIVYATGDVSAVAAVYRDTVTQDIYGAYTGVSQPSTQVHVPLVQRGNARKRIVSLLSIQNTGDVATEAVVTYKAGHTNTSCTKSYQIPAFGLARVKMTEVECSPYRFGSVFIQSKQPVAVTATQLATKDNTWFMIWSSAAGSARRVYAPLIQNGNSNIQAGLMLQTASGNSNNLRVNYYRKEARACGNNSYNGVRAFYAQQVYPAPPAGNTCSLVSSAKFSGSQNMAAIVNQARGNEAAIYEAIAKPGKKVIVPLWMYLFLGWSSGLVVQNTASQDTNVTLDFYYDWGPKASEFSVRKTLKPNEIYVFWKQPLDSIFKGSVVVTANRNVAVMVNHLNEGLGLTATTTDPLMSHSGIHR